MPGIENVITLLKNKYGRQFYVFDKDTFFKARASVGPYQLTNLRYLRSLVPNAHTILDLGAHIGSNTVEYATWAKHVLSFEPDMENFEVLTKNTKLTQTQPSTDFKKSWYEKEGVIGGMTCVAEITLFNYAVGNENKDTYILKVPNNYGHNRIARSRETDTYKQQPIQMVQLDNVVDINKYHVDIMKLDIEGYELFALQGAKKIIDTCRPIIQCETLPDMCRVFHITPQTLCDYLASKQYRMFLNDGREVPIGNWFVVKRKIDRFYIPAEKVVEQKTGFIF